MITRFLVAILVAIGLVAASIGPASANNKNLTHPSGGGNATWTDATDTLCARAYAHNNNGAAVRWAEAEIRPVDGTGPEFTIRDSSPGNGAANCTGNLNIPEDNRYRMYLRIRLASGATQYADDTFYT